LPQCGAVTIIRFDRRLRGGRYRCGDGVSFSGSIDAPFGTREFGFRKPPEVTAMKVSGSSFSAVPKSSPRSTSPASVPTGFRRAGALGAGTWEVLQPRQDFRDSRV